MFDDFLGMMKFNSLTALLNQQRYGELFLVGTSFLIYYLVFSSSLCANDVYKYYLSYHHRKLFASIVQIEGERVFTKGIYTQDVRSYFSNSFQGIWNRMLDLQPRVFKLKESVNVLEDRSVLNETFIVDQTVSFYLEQDIYAVVSARESTSDEKGQGCVSTVSSRIELFSYVHDVYFLKAYVKKWEEVYLDALAKSRSDKLFMYTLRKSKDIEWHESEFKSNKSFDTLFFKNKYQVMQKIRHFMENEAWYASEGIPYTLGICIRGPPGTGKTSLIKAIVNEVRRVVVLILLNMIESEEALYDVYFDQKYNSKNKEPILFSKKILVFEDIDCMIDIIKKRDGLKKVPVVCPVPMVEPKPEIRLSFLLNLLDGLQESHGRIMIMTTNCYHEIDPALVRPGRIDLTIDMGNADFETVDEVYQHYYKEPIPEEDALKLADIEIMPSRLINIRKDARDKEHFLQLLKL